MIRLRHPIRAIREPFGTAGLIVACLALVLAMGGAAVAAKGSLTGKQKKEVEKIAKKYAGKPGAAGAAGAPGPAGPGGAKGDKGDAGTNGTNGTNGKSVETGNATVQECSSGGATVQVAGEPSTKKKICNGQTGFTEVLPEGKTETGIWRVEVPQLGTDESLISFPIPLASSLPAASAGHIILKNGKELVTNPVTEEPEEAASTACTGTVSEPTAETGQLCIYAGSPLISPGESAGPFLTPVEGEAFIDPTKSPEVSGIATSGTILKAQNFLSGTKVGYGTWAVTAE